VVDKQLTRNTVVWHQVI